MLKQQLCLYCDEPSVYVFLDLFWQSKSVQYLSHILTPNKYQGSVKRYLTRFNFNWVTAQLKLVWLSLNFNLNLVKIGLVQFYNFGLNLILNLIFNLNFNFNIQMQIQLQQIQIQIQVNWNLVKSLLGLALIDLYLIPIWQIS